MNENIVKINYLDKEIYLVKTAHVSKMSVEDVKNSSSYQKLQQVVFPCGPPP